MNEMDFKNLWQKTNEKLEESFVINRNNTEDITRMKVYNFISSMKPIKIFALLFGILWVGVGISLLSPIYLNAFSEANKYFLFSASIQVGITAIALLIYLYQLFTISEVDISDSVLKTQKKLASLKLSTIWVTRILFLQLPVWTTFWWNETMFNEWKWYQWAATGIVTLLFTYFAIWLFFNIKYENRNKKWFKRIFKGKEWTPLMNSIELIEQINYYKDK
jgi:hypothetical protein